MKRGMIFGFILVSILFISASLVWADFEAGDEVADIEDKYAPGDYLRGWVNISLEQEDADSLLSAFEDEIEILDFLEKSGAEFNCSTNNCVSAYSDSGVIESFFLNPGDEKVIGMKIEGNEIEEIIKFEINLKSSAGKFDKRQLEIDILNDGETDWKSDTASGDFGSEDYGCYEAEQKKGETEITSVDYCERITLQSFPNVKIGADVAGEGDAKFTMKIYNDDYEKECTASVSGAGKAECLAELSTEEEQDFFVCIKKKSGEEYKIAYEQNESCDFSGDFEDEYTYDFAVFAKPGQYAAVGEFVLNEESVKGIKDEILSYIDDVYDSECADSCIVPVKFKAGVLQTIEISSAELKYIAGISKTSSEVYELEEVPAKIDMGFQELDLEKAELPVPEKYGAVKLNLELDSERIVQKDIYVVNIPVIKSVYPTTAPAGIPVNFYVSTNATSYSWDFGDGTEEETETNSIKHTYSEIKTYVLKISVENELGESSRSFDIRVVSPKDYLNENLNKSFVNLNKTRKQIEAVSPAWLKEQMKRMIGFDEMESSLRALERRYESAAGDENYISIAEDLVALKVPSSLNVSDSGAGKFFIDSKIINVDYLSKLGAGRYDSEHSKEDYENAISAWFVEIFDADIDNRVYSLYYDEGYEPLVSYFKLNLKADKEVEDVYLVVDLGGAGFGQDYGEKEINEAGAMGIVFSDLKEKDIEFSVPGRFIIFDAPVYFSPKFSELNLELEIGVCDFDGKCEGKENWENCRADCKPWGRGILYIFIVLFIGFCAYIGLQEWYKRYYEGRLFKDKNELFNLINFMNNALNKGMAQKEIAGILKKHGWNSEKIKYAYRKFKGKRTGMWEIPLFKWVENRKVKEELAKRKNRNIQM